MDVQDILAIAVLGAFSDKIVTKKRKEKKKEKKKENVNLAAETS